MATGWRAFLRPLQRIQHRFGSPLNATYLSMGNATSRSSDVLVHHTRERDETPTLDELGGWDRPAIRRGDSLNKKLEWLQVREAMHGESTQIWCKEEYTIPIISGYKGHERVHARC